MLALVLLYNISLILTISFCGTNAQSSSLNPSFPHLANSTLDHLHHPMRKSFLIASIFFVSVSLIMGLTIVFLWYKHFKRSTGIVDFKDIQVKRSINTTDSFHENPANIQMKNQLIEVPTAVPYYRNSPYSTLLNTDNLAMGEQHVNFEAKGPIFHTVSTNCLYILYVF